MPYAQRRCLGLALAFAAALFAIVCPAYAKESSASVKDAEQYLAKGDLKAAEIELRNAIRGLVDGGKKKILLNLRGVKNIDSSGIGELIANYTTVSRDGGQLKLLNLTEKIQNLLVITKLLTVFDAYDNEAEALNSFK